LIRRAAEGVAVGSAVFVGDISNVFDLCDSYRRKEQRGRARAYRRRSLMHGSRDVRAGALLRGDVLFHGRTRNMAAQLRRDGPFP
jgi:hypothetical protein